MKVMIEHDVPPLAKDAPVGTRVLVLKDNGSTVRTKTRSVPWQLSGHTWVVAVDGISGGYALTRVFDASELPL